MIGLIASALALISAFEQIQSAVAVKSEKGDCSLAGINQIDFPGAVSCTGYRQSRGSTQVYYKVNSTYNDYIGYDFAHFAKPINVTELPEGCKNMPPTLPASFWDGSQGTVLAGGWGMEDIPEKFKPELPSGRYGYGGRHPYRQDPAPLTYRESWGDSAYIYLYGWADGVANYLLCKIIVETTGLYPTVDEPTCDCH